MTTQTSKTSRNRGAAVLAALIAVAAATACSYNETKGDVAVHVTNLPASASQAAVVVTTSNGDPAKKYCPLFAVQSGTVDLAIPAPSAGTYTMTVQVAAFDADDNYVAVGSGTTAAVALPAATPVDLTIPVSAQPDGGTPAARCGADAGP